MRNSVERHIEREEGPDPEEVSESDPPRPSRNLGRQDLTCGSTSNDTCNNGSLYRLISLCINWNNNLVVLHPAFGCGFMSARILALLFVKN